MKILMLLMSQDQLAPLQVLATVQSMTELAA